MKHIDIKMAEARITEPNRQHQHLTIAMKDSANQCYERQTLLRIDAERRASGSNGRATYFEGKHLGSELDIVSNEDITLYKDFGGGKRSQRQRAARRRGSSCSSTGNEVADREHRQHQGRNGALQPHKTHRPRLKKPSGLTKKALGPQNTRSSIIPWQMKDSDADGGLASRQLNATNLSLMQL